MKNSDNSSDLKFPNSLINPIKKFLEEEIIRLKRREKSLKEGDPFTDVNRDIENSVEEDVDEQMGHFDVEVKVNFIRKQIVQLRKALTRIKLGKYGTCERCGKMIDTDRLAAKPDATICIDCEKERES
ncbi:MAG: TraR/DksA family transcriptional regulator [Patescibacteria group bacterium]|jgi:DnaK suppressor protein